ncbi:hypothetical protein D9M71_253520 [compost metagenome]
MAGIRLEVEAFIDANHCRPAGKVLFCRAGEGERATSARLQADARHPALLGHTVRPGTCSIDQTSGLQTAAISQLHLPHAAQVAGLDQLGVAAQFTAGSAITPQEALVQGMYIKVHRTWLKHRAGQGFATQAGYQCQGRVPVQQADFCAIGQVLRVSLLKQFTLLQAGHIQTASRLQQRVLAEALRWRFVEGSAGAGQCLDLWGAVSLHEHGRRTPGGMVARLRFTLDQQHALLTGQAVAQRSAGDASTDDQGVVGRGHARSCQANYHL